MAISCTILVSSRGAVTGDKKTLSIPSGRRDQVLITALRLEVLEGPDRGQVFTATSNRMLIGTHGSVDVVLTDPTVSRFHCELCVDEHGIRLRDLESHNGTIVDSMEVIDGYCGVGSVLALGASRVRVQSALDPIAIRLTSEDRFGPLYGKSAAMRALFAVLEKAAASEATVIIEGETGTGKDVAAMAIHAASSRSDGPLVVVDCGALPATLLESELFGHRKGAFTGASQDRVGAFEAAHGGTLFLDEIGELDLALQPNLLRAIESRRIRPLGSDTDVPIDIRVIAATNRRLGVEVNAKRFRSDLYYRLAVLTVRMPPLRERLEDIPGLVQEILRLQGRELEPAAQLLAGKEVQRRLQLQAWPGNVRELRNYVEQCLAFGTLPAVSAARQEHGGSGGAVDTTLPYREARKQWLARFERLYLDALLLEHGDNVRAAAQTAGVDRVHLYRLLSRAGLR